LGLVFILQAITVPLVASKILMSLTPQGCFHTPMIPLQSDVLFSYQPVDLYENLPKDYTKIFQLRIIKEWCSPCAGAEEMTSSVDMSPPHGQCTSRRTSLM